MTSITIQIPYELYQPPPNGGLIPTIEFFVTENGVAGFWSIVNPVPAQVHILTACDTVLGGPGTIGCHQEVTHANGMLVSSANPASVGEELVAYAVGLGATNPAVPTGQPATQPTRTVVKFGLGFNFQADAPPSAPPPSQVISPLYAGLTPGYPGLYQINFVVPAVPAGLPACAPGPGSEGPGPGQHRCLTVSVGNAAAFKGSFDGAGACVLLPE